MKICEYHDIAYTDKICPCCLLEEDVNFLEQKIRKLEEEIRDMETT